MRRRRIRRGVARVYLTPFVHGSDLMTRKAKPVTAQEFIKEIKGDEFCRKALSPPKKLYKIINLYDRPIFSTEPEQKLLPGQIYAQIKLTASDPATIKKEWLPQYAFEIFGFRNTVYAGLIDMKRKLIAIIPLLHLYSNFTEPNIRMACEIINKVYERVKEIERRRGKFDFILFLENTAGEPIKLLSEKEIKEKYS